MKLGSRLSLALVLAAVPVMGATKDRELPDKEMLRMMEFLRELEMIKQMEMLREMQRIEAVGAEPKQSAPGKAAVAKKETTK